MQKYWNVAFSISCQFDTIDAPELACTNPRRCYFTAVLAWNGVFRKAMDTQFIIIVDKDTMVSIIYPKCDDAVVHQIAEIYYGIHSIPKILLWYIITKYPNMLPRYLKENQSPLTTSWHFLFICFYIFLNLVTCFLMLVWENTIKQLNFEKLRQFKWRCPIFAM